MALRRPRAKKDDKVTAPVAPTPDQPDTEAPAPVDETPAETPATPVSAPNHDEEW